MCPPQIGLTPVHNKNLRSLSLIPTNQYAKSARLNTHNPRTKLSDRLTSPEIASFWRAVRDRTTHDARRTRNLFLYINAQERRRVLRYSSALRRVKREEYCTGG